MAIPDKEERLRRAAICRRTIEHERIRRGGESGSPKQTGSGELPGEAVKGQDHNAPPSSDSYSELATSEEEFPDAPASEWKPRSDDGAGLLRPPDSPTHTFERKPGSSACAQCSQGVQHANHAKPVEDAFAHLAEHSGQKFNPEQLTRTYLKSYHDLEDG